MNGGMKRTDWMALLLSSRIPNSLLEAIESLGHSNTDYPTLPSIDPSNPHPRTLLDVLGVINEPNPSMRDPP